MSTHTSVPPFRASHLSSSVKAIRELQRIHSLHPFVTDTEEGIHAHRTESGLVANSELSEKEKESDVLCVCVHT